MPFRSTFSPFGILATALSLGLALCASSALAEDPHHAAAASHLHVSGEGSVGAVKVSVRVEHAHTSDLIVTLGHEPEEGDPSTVTLAERAHDSELFEGELTLPEAFAGRDAAGEWTINVTDQAFGDHGELEHWKLALQRCDADRNCVWEDHTATHAVAIPDLHMNWGSIEFWGAIVNFGLLLLILVYLGKAPLSSFLVGRRDQIQANLLEARELRAQAQKSYDEASQRLNRLDSELETIRQDMIKAGEEERARIVAEAEKKASRMRKDATFLIEQQLKQLSIELKRQTVEASVKAARTAIESSINDEDQRRIADDYLSRIRTIGLGEGKNERSRS